MEILASFFGWMNHKLECLFIYISFEGILAVTASILALLIPVALLVIENNGNSTDGSFKWDKMVLFNQVIDIKNVVVGLSLIVFPLVLWSKENYVLNTIVLLAYLYGLSKVLTLLKNSYYWIVSKKIDGENFKNINRQKYIESLSSEDFQTRLEVWDLIWNDSKEREGMDRDALLDLYFEQYSKLIDSKEKRSFLLVFYRDFDLDYYTFKKTQELLEDNLAQVLPKEENNDFDNQRYLLWSLYNQLFLEFSRKVIGDRNYEYEFKNWFDKLLLNFSDHQYNEFLSSVGMDFLEIVRLSVYNYNYYELDYILPNNLVYDNVNGKEKKDAIKNVFMNWLKNSYIILPEKNLKDKFFANKIFEFIFQKAEPISFFRIIGFTMFINDFVYDEQILEERIFAYASEPNIFIGIGRIYSFNKESDSSNFENRIIAEKNWTYKFILHLGSQGYYYLQNEDILNKVIHAIEQVRTKNADIDELGLARLNGVHSELLGYKKILQSEYRK